MSEENEGEEKQNDNFSQEFEFYFSFTKPLVLELPTEEDRALAAAWVQKLETEPKTIKEKEQQLNYLKLLLFVLQRGRLSGIFARQPPSGPLQPFPQGFSVLDMGNLMLEQDDDLLYGGGDAGRIPYTMELSNDLREYVASQEIPNFGVQMYYAWSSDEPIHKWSLFDEEKFSQYILEKIKQMKAEKYDEKSQKPTDGCTTEKVGCNFPFPDMLTKKKVKSPEEIEKSQRSFLMYMGLVGRMGNFNDRCDEDPEKFQRQNIPRKTCPKRKTCPTNGGAEDVPGEEDFDNFVSGLGGGLNFINRPCFCNYPNQQQPSPPQHSKKRPQSSGVENQQMCFRGNTSNAENPHWSTSACKSGGASRMRDQCLDGSISGMLPQQRNTSSRSNSLNRRTAECSPEGNRTCERGIGNSGGFPNQGEVCVCSSPPCTCPCPRAPPKSPPANTTLPGNGGRVCQSPSRTCPRPARQDAMECNVNRNRGIGSQLTSFNAPEPCTPASARPDMTPAGGRTCGSSGGSGLRPVQPMVVHCYDNQNPDPALTRTIEKNDNWLPLEGGGVKYMDTEFKTACMRDQLIADAMQDKCTVPARRELFDSQPQPGPSGMGRQRPQNDCSPPLATHPLCEYSPSSPSQQESFPQQQSSQTFMENEDYVPQSYPVCGEGGGRINTNTCKKTQPQTTVRAKSTGLAPGPFAVTNENARLANLTTVLRGIKQKTEAHREKYEEPGLATPNEPYCTPGIQNQTQTKPSSGLPGQRNRGEGFAACANEQTSRSMTPGRGTCQAPPPTPQQACNFPNKGYGNVCNSQGRDFMTSQYPSLAYDFTLYKMPVVNQREDYDPSFEQEEEEDDDEECESSASVEDACQSELEDWSMQLSNRCKAALNRRQQDYYKLTFWEEGDCESPESSQDINCSEAIKKAQEQAKGNTTAKSKLILRENNQYPGMNTTPADFGTMMSANDTSYGSQWMSPKRVPVPSMPSTQRGITSTCMENDFRNIASVRASPGRAFQREANRNEQQRVNTGLHDEACARNPTAQGNRQNRYMEQSATMRSRPTRQPRCSTPLRHHKDRGFQNLSGIHPP